LAFKPSRFNELKGKLMHAVIEVNEGENIRTLHYTGIFKFANSKLICLVNKEGLWRFISLDHLVLLEEYPNETDLAKKNKGGDMEGWIKK